MAITQQIAALPIETLQVCVENEGKLDEMVSFQLLEEDDYVDVDWSVSYLLKLFQLNEKTRDVASALKLVLEGEGVVNANYVECEEAPVYINNDGVETIASALRQGNVDTALEFLPENIKEINECLGSEFDANPHDYLKYHYSLLREMYSAAESASRVIVTWWD